LPRQGRSLCGTIVQISLFDEEACGALFTYHLKRESLLLEINCRLKIRSHWEAVDGDTNRHEG
jgi:hypothetical protein